MEGHVIDEIDIDEYDAGIGEHLKALGRQKGVVLSKSKKTKSKNTERIKELDADIKLLQKYHKRIAIFSEGSKTISKGIYLQKKRNTYKIDPIIIGEKINYMYLYSVTITTLKH